MQNCFNNDAHIYENGNDYRQGDLLGGGTNFFATKLVIKHQSILTHILKDLEQIIPRVIQNFGSFYRFAQFCDPNIFLALRAEETHLLP